MISHTEDLEKPDGDAYGRQLRGIGVNLLVRDILRTVEFLVDIMGMTQVYSNPDFAILAHDGMELMLHVDGTYHSNPLLGLTGDGAIRGIGAEIRLYGIDPDQVQRRAEAAQMEVLQPATDKPHGLREIYVQDPDGYVWVASVEKKS